MMTKSRTGRGTHDGCGEFGVEGMTAGVVKR